MFSDSEILKAIKAGSIGITPFSRSQLGPNSYDLRLNRKYRLQSLRFSKLDIIEEAPPSMVYDLSDVLIPPHATAVVMTMEKVSVRNDVCGMLTPRSGFARLPLAISYSQLVDTGYDGVLGCSLTNLASYPIVLHEKQRFMQIMFSRTEGKVLKSYEKRKNSKYTDNDGSDVPEYRIDKEWLEQAAEGI